MPNDLSERLKALGDKLRRVKELVNGTNFGDAEFKRVHQLLNSIDESKLADGVVPEAAADDQSSGDTGGDAPVPTGPGQGPGGN